MDHLFLVLIALPRLRFRLRLGDKFPDFAMQRLEHQCDDELEPDELWVRI